MLGYTDGDGSMHQIVRCMASAVGEISEGGSFYSRDDRTLQWLKNRRHWFYKHDFQRYLPESVIAQFSAPPKRAGEE